MSNQKEKTENSADEQMAAEKLIVEKPVPTPKNEFKSVFESNPQADEIFVVDGMPFLEHNHAMNFAKGNKNAIQTIKRKNGKTISKIDCQCKGGL